MPIDILMPALSPTMEEGNLAKWHVKEGDSVSSGDVIAEIETDKATMEVEAVDEGTVGKIFVNEGAQGVKVNEVIAVLLEEGEDASAISDAPASPKPQDKKPDKEEKAPESPPPQKQAAPSASPTAGHTAGNSETRVFSSPLARRLAEENGLDIAKIKGTGPHGRVIKRDIENALSKGGQAAAAPQQAGAGAAKADEALLKLFDKDSYDIAPHDNMRKTIARRLTEAKQTVPHFYLTVDCKLDALLNLRKQLNDAAPKNEEGKPLYKLSVNDLVIKAHALALKAVPSANASWSGEGMLMHKQVDVGVAVAIEGGLITPIIRKAEQKPLSTISNEMKDMASRARARKLQPQEYQGGTTAVSNLGMFGVKDFAAVINPPHATILAVGAGEQRAVVENGELAVATVMSVTLSTDHRAVDGALGAQLMQAFRNYIENPMGMLV